MRILAIAPTPFFSNRGSHIRIRDQINFLQRAGHDVELVTYHIGEEVGGISAKRIPNFFWYKKTGPGASFHKLYLDYFVFARAFFQIINFKPDVLHCHGYEGAFIGILLRFIFRKKVLFDSQGSLVDELVQFGSIKRDSLTYKFFFVVEKYICRLSNIIIVSNSANKDELIHTFGIHNDRVHVIPDGIISKDFEIDDKLKEQFARNLQITSWKKKIVYLGGLSKMKGIDDILDIAEKLQNKEIEWLIAGYPHTDYYRNEVKKRGLEKTVKIWGEIKYDISWNYLIQADFLITLKAPSTQGNGKLLQYALVGKPIICYSHHSNRSIIGDDAIFINHFESLSEKADQLFREVIRPVDKEMVERAKNRVIEHFYYPNIIRKLERVYEHIH